MWTYIPVLPAPSGDPVADHPWAELEALRRIAELLEVTDELAKRDRATWRPGAGFPPDVVPPDPDLKPPPEGPVGSGGGPP